MAMFDTQPIKKGCGPVHVNRFRIAFRAPGLRPDQSAGQKLFAPFPEFMNPDTARVEHDRQHPWLGLPSLCFHGRARIRPFNLPFIPLPLGPFGTPILLPVTGPLRQLELPPFHVDYVGAVHTGHTGFTVQTLTRNFWRPEDSQMEAAARAAIEAVVAAENAAGLFGFIIALPTRVIAEALLKYAMQVNRHHFLAGRRSFRIDQAASMGQRNMGADVWVFETAAVERFARPEFQAATDFLLGGDKVALGPIWKQMCRRLAKHFGTPVPIRAADTAEGAAGWKEEGGVLFVQNDVHDLAAVPARIVGFKQYHPAIFDPS